MTSSESGRWACPHSLDFIQREKLDITISTVNRRLNHASDQQSQFFRRVIHFLDYARALRRVAHNPSLAYFPATYFKLWLDERNQQARIRQQRYDRRHDHGCRDEGDVHHHEIKVSLKVARLEITGVDAFSNFYPGVRAQSIIYLVMTDIESDDVFGSVL